MAGIYETWEKSPRTPETMEEIRSYADSQRAVAELAMHKRRRTLIASAERHDRTKARRFARGKIKKNKGVGSKTSHALKNSSSSALSRKTQKTTIKQKPVFVRPDDQNKKRGVFKW